jgi:hypothetical protein
MASGDTLCVWNAAHMQAPASNFAVFNTLNSELELDFDNTTGWSAIFRGLLPRNYSGGGVTLTIHWCSAATSGAVVWNGAFERNQDGTSSLASDNFASAQAVTTTTNGTANIIQTSVITFTNGAQMSSVAAGETFRFKLSRVPGGSDTMAAQAKVFNVELKET